MTSSNDSTIVLRLPQELKATLQQQAELIDVSLSEIIRMKLLIAENAVHREPVIRVGGETYRLWDILRPDVLQFDLVASAEVPNVESIIREEPGRNSNPTGIDATDAVMEAIANARAEALRTGSAEIAPVHLALAMLRADSNATRIVAALAGSLSNVVRDLEDEARSLPTTGKKGAANKDIPFTKLGAKVLKVFYLEALLYKRAVGDTTILLLALLRDTKSNARALAAHGVTYEATRALSMR